MEDLCHPLEVCIKAELKELQPSFLQAWVLEQEVELLPSSPLALEVVELQLSFLLVLVELAKLCQLEELLRDLLVRK